MMAKCAGCGVAFRIFPSTIKRENRGKFCSRQCCIQSKTTDCSCQFCGKTFHRANSRVAAGRKAFCSGVCRSKGHAFLMRGNKNPRWKGGRNLIQKRNSFLKRSYGIDLEDYKRMKSAQRGLCAICGRPNKDKRGYDLYVDHNHQTGKVRGLLCSRCNHLVMAFDHPLAENVKRYVQQHAQAGDLGRATSIEQTEDAVLDVPEK